MLLHIVKAGMHSTHDFKKGYNCSHEHVLSIWKKSGKTLKIEYRWRWKRKATEATYLTHSLCWGKSHWKFPRKLKIFQLSWNQVKKLILNCCKCRSKGAARHWHEVILEEFCILNKQKDNNFWTKTSEWKSSLFFMSTF